MSSQIINIRRLFDNKEPVVYLKPGWGAMIDYGFSGLN